MLWSRRWPNLSSVRTLIGTDGFNYLTNSLCKWLSRYVDLWGPLSDVWLTSRVALFPNFERLHEWYFETTYSDQDYAPFAIVSPSLSASHMIIWRRNFFLSTTSIILAPLYTTKSCLLRNSNSQPWMFTFHHNVTDIECLERCYEHFYMVTHKRNRYRTLGHTLPQTKCSESRRMDRWGKTDLPFPLPLLPFCILQQQPQYCLSTQCLLHYVFSNHSCRGTFDQVNFSISSYRNIGLYSLSGKEVDQYVWEPTSETTVPNFQRTGLWALWMKRLADMFWILLTCKINEETGQVKPFDHLLSTVIGWLK